MRRYLFNLEDGENGRDLSGGFFPNDEAAKQEANLRALNGSGHQLEPYGKFDALIVRNEEGTEIFRKKIRPRTR
jgi:hypothetical protein